MDGRQKTRRKILGLRNQKAGTGLSTLKDITTTLEMTTQVGEVEAKAKTCLYAAWTMKEIRIIGQEIVPSSLNPRKNEPYIPLAPTIIVIILTLPFVPTLQLLLRVPVQLP
jgi:hypothetical protein